MVRKFSTPQQQGSSSGENKLKLSVLIKNVAVCMECKKCSTSISFHFFSHHIFCTAAMLWRIRSVEEENMRNPAIFVETATDETLFSRFSGS